MFNHRRVESDPIQLVPDKYPQEEKLELKIVSVLSLSTYLINDNPNEKAGNEKCGVEGIFSESSFTPCRNINRFGQLRFVKSF